METIQNYIKSNEKRFVDELIDLLKIPSVSADSKYAKDVARAADYIKSELVKAGADKVEVCTTPGHPIVYGEKIIDPKLPTVIVYGHYDVQPPDPLNLWNSPPCRRYYQQPCDRQPVRILHQLWPVCDHP